MTTEQQSEQVITPDATQTVDSDADLTAGFDEVRGGKSAPTEKPEAAKVETAAPKSDRPAEAVKEEKAPDEWEGVSPKVKSEIESMREKLGGFDKIAEQLRTINGHIGGLTSQQKQIRDALAQAKTSTEKQGSETPTQAQVADAGQSAARWKQLKEDFPDWAEAVDERLAEITAKTATAQPAVDSSKLKEEFLGEVDSRFSNLGRDAVAQARVFARLDLKHDPEGTTDWQADVNSPEYDAWIKTQKPEIQALSSSSAVKDASRLITLFRDHKAQGAKAVAAKAEREDRLKRAVQPQGTKVYEMTEDPSDALVAGFNEVRGN